MSNDGFTVNPDLISLDGLYTDISDPNAKDTTVYANGTMQARIYIGYSYEDYSVDDSDPDVINALNDYVVNYIEFYQLDDSNNLTALTGWEQSTESNGYPHNIDYLESDSNPSPYAISGQRVPYYLIPPPRQNGTLTELCAVLINTDPDGDNKQTDVDHPAKINTKKFELQDANLRIRDIKSIDYIESEIVLRSLYYTSAGNITIPDSHKPMKLTPYQGVKANGDVTNLTAHGKETYPINSWIAMARSSQGYKTALFVEEGETNIAALAIREEYTYQSVGVSISADTISGAGGWDGSVQLKASDVTDGIAMCKITNVSLWTGDAYMSGSDRLDITTQNFTLEDNYGNIVSFDMDWDDHSDGNDWYHDWQPENVNVTSS